MKKILEWLLSFFKPEKEKKIASKIEELEEDLKEIEDEDISLVDIDDHFNE
jgi:hypothetical protein